jgi:hypothetical protein
MAKKSIDAQRRADVEATLAREDIASRHLEKLMRRQNQVEVLAEWASAAFGKDAARAFNRLRPAQVGKLLAAAVKAAEGANFHICAADSAMRAAIEAVQP